MRSILKEALGEYVKGNALQKTDFSSFPLVLRDLQLNEKKVQEEFDEFNDSAIQLTCGKIGSIKVTPSWMGTVEVVATNIELSLSFSPTQALKNQMKPQQADDQFEKYDTAPPPNCAPRFCPSHDTSDKRVKGDPVSRDCKACGITLTSSYKDFRLCPPCSEKEQKCMICAAHAPKQTSVQPAAPPAPPPNCPPRFCCEHDSSDKRVKGNPVSRDCKACGITLQSSYKDFQLCPPCSEHEQKCMICGCRAPKTGSYMPEAPQGQEQGQGQRQGHGQNGSPSKHGAPQTRDNLPPPPPPFGNQTRDGMASRQSRPEANGPPDAGRSMYMSNSNGPPDAGRSMCMSNYLNSDAAAASMYQQRGPPPPPPRDAHKQRSSQQPSECMQNDYGNSQEFHTQLPPPQSQQRSRGQPQPHGAPWDQNRGAMSARPYSQSNDQASIGGFLRFVAGDIWKTCNSNNTRPRYESTGDRYESPERPGFIRRGGA